MLQIIADLSMQKKKIKTLEDNWNYPVCGTEWKKNKEKWTKTKITCRTPTYALGESQRRTERETGRILGGLKTFQI